MIAIQNNCCFGYEIIFTCFIQRISTNEEIEDNTKRHSNIQLLLLFIKLLGCLFVCNFQLFCILSVSFLYHTRRRRIYIARFYEVFALIYYLYTYFFSLYLLSIMHWIIKVAPIVVVVLNAYRFCGGIREDERISDWLVDTKIGQKEDRIKKQRLHIIARFFFHFLILRYSKYVLYKKLNSKKS